MWGFIWPTVLTTLGLEGISPLFSLSHHTRSLDVGTSLQSQVVAVVAVVEDGVSDNCEDSQAGVRIW